MERVSEGAEAAIFEIKLSGRPLLIKARNRKAWRIAIIDEELRERRTRKEAKLMIMAKKAGAAVPEVAAIGKYSIFMQKIEGKLLKDSRPTAKDMQTIGRYLGYMHSKGITHGDFTSANLMLTSKGPCIIDFGLGNFSNSEEEKALDLLLLERSVSKANYTNAMKGYTSVSKEYLKVISRLDEIKKRGRYQTRTLA